MIASRVSGLCGIDNSWQCETSTWTCNASCCCGGPVCWCQHDLVSIVSVSCAGLLAVRGAEVVEVRDEEGGLMNDFTGRVRIEDRKPPKGE